MKKQHIPYKNLEDIYVKWKKSNVRGWTDIATQEFLKQQNYGNKNKQNSVWAGVEAAEGMVNMHLKSIWGVMELF